MTAAEKIDLAIQSGREARIRESRRHAEEIGHELINHVVDEMMMQAVLGDRIDVTIRAEDKDVVSVKDKLFVVPSDVMPEVMTWFRTEGLEVAPHYEESREEYGSWRVSYPNKR